MGKDFRPKAIPEPESPRKMAPARFPWMEFYFRQYGYDEPTWNCVINRQFSQAMHLETVLNAIVWAKNNGIDMMMQPFTVLNISGKDHIWCNFSLLLHCAHRTETFIGNDPTEFGPMIEEKFSNEYNGQVTEKTIIYPEWAKVSVLKLVNGQPYRFHGQTVYWKETYRRKYPNGDLPNDMWLQRPSGQLEKCAFVSALRIGFPAMAGIYIEEEIAPADSVRLAPRRAVGESAKSTRQALSAAITYREPETIPDFDHEPSGEMVPRATSQQDETPPKTQEADYDLDPMYGALAEAEDVARVHAIRKGWGQKVPERQRDIVRAACEDAIARLNGGAK